MLFGREHEIGVVRQLLEEVAGGNARVLVVGGVAGIGKTRLMAEVVEYGRSRGFTRYSGAAESAERGRPFSAISHVLSSRRATPELDRIARMLATGERGRPWVDPVLDAGFVVTDALVESLELEAQRAPVLVALDDVQWADRASVHVLSAVQRRLSGLPVAVILTSRLGAEPSYVQELLDGAAGVSTHVVLGALDIDAIAALAGEQAGGVPGESLCRQLSQVGGNPFFAVELVRGLREMGLLDIADGVVDSRSAVMPAGLVQTVLRRLRLLPAETIEVLRTASILGQSFSVVDLAALTGRNSLDLLSVLSPALRSGALYDAGDQLAFGHAITWEAVYDELPVAVRRAVHRHAADVLAAAGVSSVRVARHLVLGADAGDARAISWLRDAARSTAASSPATAAELLGNALDLADVDRDSVIAELAPLLVVTGQIDRAAAMTAEALARELDPATEARLRVGMTHVLMRAGRVDEASRQASVLLDRLPTRRRELAKGVASYVYLASGDVDRAEAVAADALVAAETGGHDVVTATALMTLTWCHGARGRIGEAVAAGERAVRVTEASRAPMSGFLFPHCPLGAALLQADRFDEAEHAFAAGLERADRTAAPGTIVYHHAGLAAGKFHVGEWDAAVSEAEVVLELTGPTATRWTLLPSAVLARIAVARDDLGAARAVIDEALSSPEADCGTMTVTWLHWAHAVLCAADGDAARGMVAAERAWTSSPELRDLAGNRLMPVDLVRLALDGGDRGFAERVATGVAEMAGWAGARAGRSLAAAAAHCHGLLERDAASLEKSVALLDGTRRVYQQALAAEDAATAVAGRDRDRSRVMYRNALSVYRRLGADRDLARVAAAMRAVGMSPAAARSRRTRAHGDLTATELSVARLVSQGLSNRQIAERLFISRHTAETHMKHILRKLGVSSRAEVAARMAGELVS